MEEQDSINPTDATEITDNLLDDLRDIEDSETNETKEPEFNNDENAVFEVSSDVDALDDPVVGDLF